MKQNTITGSQLSDKLSPLAEIPHQIAALHDGLSSIQHKIEILEERLGFILMPDFPTPAGNEDMPAVSTQMGQQLLGVNDRLIRYNSALMKLIDRLAI